MASLVSRRRFLEAVSFALLLSGCGKDQKPDLSALAWVPATATALLSCNNKTDCAASTLGKRFGIPPYATPVVLYQNEYSPAFLLPATAAVPKASGTKSHRGVSYNLLPNPLKGKPAASTPAGHEAWAHYAWPGGQVVGGESAVTDVIDVVTGAKPPFLTARAAYKPMLEKFALRPTVEYTFSTESQEEGRAGAGLGAILTTLPVQTLLSPVTGYKGRAMLLERDGARCAVTYAIQLNGSIASRTLSGLLYSALAAGTVAGWPLGPEYLSKWKTDRDGSLVTARLDLTKAGCDYLSAP